VVEISRRDKRRRKEEWGPHNHCRICGRAIPGDEKYCSTDCRGEYEEKEKKRERFKRIYYVGLAVITLVAVAMWLMQR